MATPHDTEFAEFHASGVHTFPQAQRLLTEAIVQAREAGQPALLVDVRAIDGFAPPSLVERHRMVREWADAAQGRVRIAVVARAEFIDGEKFGVVAARNFGLQGDVFTCENDAREWLRLQRADAPR